MADSTHGSPALIANGAAPNGVEIPRDTQQKREKGRNRKKKAPIPLPADGTVSDSVVNPTSSPRPQRQAMQRRSLAGGPAPVPNGNPAKVNGAKGRPVSLAGPMFPATPAKEQAYAGPTFHASPAPSSLPMPKFFSKSVPNDGASLQSRLEAEKTPERQDSSPELDVVSPTAPHEGLRSPLDLFFNADKEEKQRTRSNGGMLSPEMATTRQAPATEPRQRIPPSGKSVFLHEMDGNHDDMPSPRTIPPTDRPPVERSHSSPGVRPQSADEEATKSLKDFLFNSANGHALQHATPPSQQQQSRAQSGVQVLQTPSPFHPRSASGPATPAPSTDQQAHYALHYGNRNLSPLFKAARNETPTRPSNLRQEVPTTADSSAPSPLNPQQTPPPPRHIPQLDSHAFGREYLDQHLPSSLPQLPFRSGAPPAPALSAPAPVPVPAPSASAPAPPHQQHNAPRGVSMVSGSPAHGGGSRDVGTMEDDLRRMLKLGVS